MIVDQLISLKSGPDPALLELEQEEQKQLLEQLHINHSDLRKRDILAAMSELLESETKQIEMYNEKRDNTSKTLLEHESNTNRLLDDLFKSNDRDRAAVVSRITLDEELQKAAFATFIEKNDARTWGLVEQVRIVESQLASMTNCEIERKKLQLDDQIVSVEKIIIIIVRMVQNINWICVFFVLLFFFFQSIGRFKRTKSKTNLHPIGFDGTTVGTKA